MGRKALICVMMIAVSGIAFTGCQAVSAILSSGITIQIENNTGYEIDPGLKVSEDDELFDLLLAESVSMGRVPAGEMKTLTYGCEELGAIFSVDATQYNIAGQVESDDSDILRQGEEYQCGDTIVFDFSGNFGDFNVETRVR